MGCSTFSNFTVLPEIAVAKIRARRAVRQGLLHRLRRDHRGRRGDQHRQGRGRAPMSSCSGSAGSASTSSRARRWSAPTGSSASTSTRPRRNGAGKFGMTDFVNPKEVGDVVAAHRPTARRRGRLQLRLHRQHRCDAPGARMLPPRLGPVDHHRRGRGGQGNLHPAVPARHRAGVEGHRVRRRQGPDRRARRSSTCTWTARSRSTR